MTSQGFLAWDATQTVRHEFVGGEVFAMASAGEAHVTVALNVAMALRQPLQGSPCRTFITDMTLRVEAADAFFYPDVMVCCSLADARSPLGKRDPVLVVAGRIPPATPSQAVEPEVCATHRPTGLRPAA